MTRWLRIASLLAVAVLARSAAAQQPTGAVARPDSLQCVAVAPDTATGFVHAVLESDAPDTRVDAKEIQRILRPLAAALASDTLTLLPVATISDQEVTVTTSRAGRQPRLMPRWAGHPALTTEVAFTVEPSGALTNARVLGRGDDATGVLLLRALATVAAVSPDGKQGRAMVRLRLSLTPDSGAVAMPLLAARQLAIPGTPPQAVDPVLSWPFRTVGPRPAAATVVVWYAVDTLGKLVEGSMGAAGTTEITNPERATLYREYVEFVKRLIGRTQHVPGEVGGCPAMWRVVFVARFNVEAPPR